MQIKEAFKKFTEERHAEDKGRNHDLLQEIYASTEFFDMSLYNFEGAVLHGFSLVHDEYVGTYTVEDLSLPFQNTWIKLKENIFMFLGEYSPEIITGTMYTTNYMCEVPEYANVTGTLNIPFIIKLKDGIISSDLDVPLIKEHVPVLLENTFQVAIQVGEVLNNLSRKLVAVDVPTGTKHEYFRRKRKPTIKVPQRPIYYVLGDKKENVTKKYNSIHSMGRLEYTSSFHVRGHWRTINEKSLGKDRNGNYGINGYSWVTVYIKGEGELTKRLRVVK